MRLFSSSELLWGTFVLFPLPCLKAELFVLLPVFVSMLSLYVEAFLVRTGHDSPYVPGVRNHGYTVTVKAWFLYVFQNFELKC